MGHKRPRLSKDKRGRQFLIGSIAYQPSAIADTGQTSAQAPQERQASASMLYCVSPSEIADTGQASAQEPQERQASEIT